MKKNIESGSKKFPHYITIFLIIMGFSCTPGPDQDNPLRNIISNKDELVDKVLTEPDHYKVQILYTQIDRDSLNKPTFTSYKYRVDDDVYFYPASTVKMPTAFLALEKINELNIPGLNRKTRMITDSAFSGQSSVISDSTAKTGFPSIEHYIKKIFLISDNDAYNRLYEFLGQQYLNERLRQKGFTKTRLTHRLSIFLSEEENQATNPVKFLKDDSLVYEKPLQHSPVDYTWPESILLGKGHYMDGEYIDEPMDFSAKNFMPVSEMQLMLRRVLFPEIYLPGERFNLTNDDYRFIYKYMSMVPRESTYPSYDSTYYDSYVKFFMFGNKMDPMPDHIRIFNKVGDAYGFLIDNAYVVDFDNKIEFLLSAVIQVNENRIYNDGIYEYDEVGFPFLSRLGTIIYEYEKERPRSREPDLSKFRIDNYNHEILRNPEK